MMEEGSISTCMIYRLFCKGPSEVSAAMCNVALHREILAIETIVRILPSTLFNVAWLTRSENSIAGERGQVWTPVHTYI